MKTRIFAGLIIIGMMSATMSTALAAFSDVNSANVNYDAVLYAEQNNIVDGYPDGSFKPNNNINRAEFTKIVVGAFTGYNPSQDPSGFDIYALVGVNFSDVVSGEWYIPYLRKAVSTEMISGYPDGTFKPAANINFAEASKIIVVGFGGDFAGAGYPPEDWFHKYVNILEEKHAIPTTIQRFDQIITRGEMIEIIYRLKANVTNKPSKTYAELSGGATVNPTPSPTPSPSPSSGTSPMIGSCTIMPADNPWNTDISGYPVHQNSANYIANIGADQNLHPDFGGNGEYGIPYNVVSAGQALVPLLNIDYADESDPGPYPIPNDAKVENGSDAHVLVVDKDACKLYELFAAEKVAGGWNAGSAAKFDLTSNALRPEGWTSADAAGLPIFPGLVRYDEVAAGTINHAIRFTVNQTQMGYIHPAVHYASSSTDPNRPPMGLRLRMKAGYDISGLSGHARIIAEAMKKYGMILADNGSDWFFQGSMDTRWDDENLNQLKGIPGSAFEVVETGPIIQ